MHLSTLFSFSLAATVAVAQYGGYGGYGGGYGDDSGYGEASSSAAAPAPASSAPPAVAAPASPPSSAADTASNSTTSGLTGGKTCVGPMCIQAVVGASTTTYELSATGGAAPGWMAIGFGSTMANTPMVILWANSDGSITVSQRQASGEVQPKLVASPPRVATVDMSSSDLTGASKTFAFTIDTDPSAGTTQSLIWAYSSQNPGSSDPGVTLVQHDSSGPTTLDVSQALAASGNGSVPVTTTSAAAPLLAYQTMMLAHGILMTIGFMLLLPIGVLVARMFRLSGKGWFTAHYILQFYLAGPIIVVGFILAIAAVQGHAGMHFNDTHKMVGAVVVVLYLLQVLLGAFIHFVKNPDRKRRPAQNYVHAVLGLTIIGLALYNVHLGYSFEWPLASGLAPLPSGINVLFIIWVIALPVIYAAGLFMLRAQFRQERLDRMPRKITMF